MRKKILSLLIASAMMISTAVFAVDNEEDTAALVTASATEVSEDENPSITADDSTVAAPEIISNEGARQVTVFVDDTLILFNDQQPVIKDDFTLVPVRGVFEAMNNKVAWNGENRTVTISSRNNLTRIVLTIDDKTMSVYHFKSIMSADEDKVSLDVAPQIMNDRTMIPLRAISEALGTEVGWDGEKYEVHISTQKSGGESGSETDTQSKLSVKLSADKTRVKVGEEVTLSVDVSNLNLYPNAYVSAITSSVSYDKDSFDFVKAYMCDSDGKDLSAMGAANPDYTDNSLKVAYVTINEAVAMQNDGVVLKFVFKAKKASSSNFALVNRYNSKLGNDNTVLIGYLENSKTKLVEGSDLIIDTTPATVIVTGTAKVETKTTSKEDEIVEDENTEATLTDNEEDVQDTEATKNEEISENTENEYSENEDSENEDFENNEFGNE